MAKKEWEEQGRVRQKRRTRRAILEAATALIEQGGRPTLEEVADAAEVSPRTVYRYFPTQEQLLTEAVLETLRPQMQRAVQQTETSGDVDARLDGLVREMWDRTLAQEGLLRTMIRLTVEARPSDAQGDGEKVPRRGYRRIEWIEMALDPLRGQINEQRFERLVSALALCIGIESLLILRDIRGLNLEEAEDVSRWAAHTLLQATLSESVTENRSE